MRPPRRQAPNAVPVIAWLPIAIRVLPSRPVPLALDDHARSGDPRHPSLDVAQGCSIAISGLSMSARSWRVRRPPAGRSSTPASVARRDFPSCASRSSQKGPSPHDSICPVQSSPRPCRCRQVPNVSGRGNHWDSLSLLSLSSSARSNESTIVGSSRVRDRHLTPALARSGAADLTRRAQRPTAYTGPDVKFNATLEGRVQRAWPFEMRISITRRRRLRNPPTLR